MGTTFKMKCPNCGKQFEWNTGSGFRGVEILHCDKCGKKKEWNHFDMVTDGDLDCKCGGMFTDDAPVRCPKCKKVIEDMEKSTEMKLLWD